MQTIDPSHNQQITGLILAGGRASRMQQRDKGLQQFNSSSLIEHVIRRIASQVSSVIINANRNQTTYAQFGYPVVSDIRNDFAGPLAGLEVGLLACKTRYLLTVPCDSPFLPLNLADRLLEELENNNADVAIACSGDAQHPHLQPVFSLIKVVHLPQLQTYLDAGGKKMSGWFNGLSMTPAYFENDAEFTNLNTLEELGIHST